MTEFHTIPLRLEVAAAIRKSILSGEYASGRELSLTDVAEQLGVSRTPVREAFQQLESEGLITLRMNKGAIVNTIDRKFITDHYEMRMLLEGEAAFRAARNRMDTSGLLEECRQLRQRLLREDSTGYNELNQRIHAAIWTAARNGKLNNTLMNLWNGPSIGRDTDTMDHQFQSNSEHIAILDYIRHGDGEMARKVMERHIERSMENILRGYRMDTLPAPLPTEAVPENIPASTDEPPVLAYIHAHIREESLCARQAADHLSISVSKISREVKKHTGMGFLDYVHSRRIAMAKPLLRESTKNVTEIAAEVGYANPLAFNRSFRRLEGTTPGSYRKNNASHS